MLGMVEAFIPPSLRLSMNLFNTFHELSSRMSQHVKNVSLNDNVLCFFFSFLANFFLSQTTLSDARTPMLTTPPYPFLFSIPLSPSLRSMSDAVVLFDCLGKVQ